MHDHDEVAPFNTRITLHFKNDDDNCASRIVGKWSTRARILWEGGVCCGVRIGPTGNIGDTIALCDSREEEGMDQANSS